MQVIVDSLLTHYEQSKNGKRVILLLHGWGDSLRTFAKLQKHLAKDFTVVSVDLPGFGATQAPSSTWNLDNYAEFVASFLAKTNIKPYAIVAHSNGGALAIRGLSLKVLDAQKLVLIGSAGIRDRQKLRRVVLKIIAKAGKVLTFWLPKRHKKKLQKALYGAAGSDMLGSPHLQETFKITVRQDVQADAAKLQLPTLLLYGADDRATPPLYGKIFHGLIKDSVLQVIDEAGHFVHHDQAEQTEQLIEEFVR